MNMRHSLLLACLAIAIVVGPRMLSPTQAQGAGPRYEVDVSWPKPFPHQWVVGPIGAACVDSQDHVLLLNRQEVLDVDLDAGQKAPPVIELNQAGEVVNAWGDGVFDQALINSFHACHFDADDHVWIVSTESGVVQKYSHDGKQLLLQIGKSSVVDSSDGTLKGKPLNSNAAQFFAPADVAIDHKTGDVYVDDGDGGGNKRVAVLDRNGMFLRQWQPDNMRSIHCMALTNDGLLYLCNRPQNRLQVYDTQFNFKRNIEIPWKAYTPVAAGDTKRRSGSAGAAVSVAVSRDAGQKWLYVINQNNSQVEVIDRASGSVVSSFGRSGHFPGSFDQPLNLTVDSKGNVYVTENRGKRVQRFKPVG